MGDLRRLDHVWRYSSIPITHTENVSQHSFYVAVYAILIHEQLQPNEPGFLTPIMLHALTHDMIESKTGDVVRTFKYSTPELKNEINKAETLLAKEFDPMMKMLFELTKDKIEMYGAGGRLYIEEVVKAADFLSLFQYMRVEALRGNMEIIPYYERMINDFIKTKINALRSKSQLYDFYTSLVDAAMSVKMDCFPIRLTKTMGKKV